MHILNRLYNVFKSRLVYFLGVFVIASLVVGLLLFYSVRQQPVSNVPVSNDQRLMIRQSPYHLGDTRVAFMHHPDPQPNPFAATFQLTTVPPTVSLCLTAIHIDPDVNHGAAIVTINGEVVVLNHYVDQETEEPIHLVVPLSRSILHTGTNEIEIRSDPEPTGVEYGNVMNIDDFEFWDLRICTE